MERLVIARPTRHISGFSLIEILIALIIISGGLLALSRMQASLLSGSAAAQQRAEASFLTQKVLELLKTRDYQDASLAQGTYPNPDIIPPATLTCASSSFILPGVCKGKTTDFDISYTVEDVPDSTNTRYKKIVARTDWTDAQGLASNTEMTALYQPSQVKGSGISLLAAESSSASSTSTSSSSTSTSTSTTAAPTTTTAAPTTTTTTTSSSTTATPTTTTTTPPTTTTAAPTTTTTVNNPPVIALTGTYSGCTQSPANASPCNAIPKSTNFIITLTATDSPPLASTSVTATVDGQGAPAIISTNYSGTEGTVVVESPNAKDKDFSVTITVTDTGGLTSSETLYFSSVN